MDNESTPLQPKPDGSHDNIPDFQPKDPAVHAAEKIINAANRRPSSDGSHDDLSGYTATVPAVNDAEALLKEAKVRSELTKQIKSKQEVEPTQNIPPEGPRGETRQAYLQSSHQELQYFFNELKNRSLTKHFKNAHTNMNEEGEYYDFNEYGAWNGQQVDNYEYRIVRQGKHYYFKTQTVVGVGKRWATGRESNDIQTEIFESDPNKLTYRKIETPSRSDDTLLKKAEIKHTLLSKKGTIEEAKATYGNLVTTIAKSRQAIGMPATQKAI